ncbi:hypothetical protein P691DRAFT_777042 [Macrolepiota fuliginosa MF-IS2]|uniref:NACHT domain-containing protein n=1 Tax=Macrolepiota fuliginosa MF-IS2 TaxID=1400762 RepID=A0A9P6BZF8_9AGAR|nr:hypothetical protein P691DRAFT_777042 [Macrolepiota fuliginosa MF-IS2]
MGTPLLLILSLPSSLILNLPSSSLPRTSVAMPLLWGRPPTRSHAPAPEPNSLGVNKPAAPPVEGPNTKSRRYIRAETGRILKGLMKSKDTHPNTGAERPLQGTWFFDDGRKWDFLWLNGPAGVGKSAVAQTVAEYALEHDVLGAVYFFSRPNQRNKYIEVFITLAYQLAVRFPGYQTLVGAKLAAEPDLPTETPRVQFRKLIVEPLLSLSHERKRVIVLDGLDEYDDEDNQLEIIELINDLVRSNISLPIIWMICSRPESHLKRVFARPDYAIQCWREFLPIHTGESRSDTEKFIRGRFKKIHERYGECLEEDADGSWPPEVSIQQVIEKTLGLFVLADALLRYIGDPETRDPDQRLGEVLAFLEYLRITGSRNPMHALDLFYSRILSSIPDDHWSIARQILIASTFRIIGRNPMAAQPLCNLLGITRARFYSAMCRLHSVIRVPNPSYATNTPINFFHATFLDDLTDPDRAGRFSIGRRAANAGTTIARAGLRDFVLPGLRCLGSTMGLALVRQHQETIRNNEEVCRSLKAALSWPSEDARANWAHAEAAVYNFRFYLPDILCLLVSYSVLDDGLLDASRRFDFNVMAFTDGLNTIRPSLPGLNRRQKPHSIVRCPSMSEWDQALISAVEEQHPGSKPLEDFDNPLHENIFFLLGDGTNTTSAFAY